jgi:transcriptional regulator with XRE-family HTH domain
LPATLFVGIKTKSRRAAMSARKTRKDLRTTASEIIKQARALENVSQHKLALLMGSSQPLVSAWECGKVTPAIDDVVAIEKALGVEQGSLLFAIAYPKNDNNNEPEPSTIQV